VKLFVAKGIKKRYIEAELFTKEALTERKEK